jgi:hypothetical protein
VSIAADGEGLAVVAVNHQSGSLAFESRGPPQSLRHLGHPFPLPLLALTSGGQRPRTPASTNGGLGVVRRSNSYDVERWIVSGVPN